MSNTNNSKLTHNAQTLRKNMTKEERHLWYDFLKNLPITVNRQKVFGNYIADFYIASAKVVIELDGSQHYETENAEYDEKRTAELEKLGLKVIRIPNNEVFKNFDDFCVYIDHTVNDRL